MKIADKIIWKKFHAEYKILDKYAYILKVIDSCETEKQLRLAVGWGLKTMKYFYDKIIYSIKFLDDSLILLDFVYLNVIDGLLSRFNEMEDEIVNHFNKSLKGIKNGAD